jgi:hypothetical protein
VQQSEGQKELKKGKRVKVDNSLCFLIFAVNNLVDDLILHY